MGGKNANVDTAKIVSLLTEHQSDLWAFIISQMPGSSDVADVLQQTNLTIWTKRAQFEIGTNFRAWAFSIARFEVLGHLKKSKRGNWLVFSDELLEVVSTEAGEKIMDSNLRLQLLEGCMGKLPPKQQELLQHRYRQKRGLANYAEAIGSTEASLYVTLHRVRAKLRKCIESGLSKMAGPETATQEVVR